MNSSCWFDSSFAILDNENKYIKQLENEIKNLNITKDNLNNKNENLRLRIKGLNEKIIKINKTKNELRIKNKELYETILKIDLEKGTKVANEHYDSLILLNDTQYNNKIKIIRDKFLKNKINKELFKNLNLKQSIKLITEENKIIREQILNLDQPNYYDIDTMYKYEQFLSNL